MNKEQTIHYLREILRLEIDCNTQIQSLNWMVKKINSLAIPRYVKREHVKLEEESRRAFLWIAFIFFIFMTLLCFFGVLGDLIRPGPIPTEDIYYWLLLLFLFLAEL